jgi:hypothetical protein
MLIQRKSALLFIFIFSIIFSCSCAMKKEGASSSEIKQPAECNGCGITVRPGTTIEVGEEVYFDAMELFDATSSGEGGLMGVYTWDFGDGYKAECDDPYHRSGLAITHFFMKPGTFTVVCNLYRNSTDAHNRADILMTKSITMTVTGETPLAGFELWHSPFNAKISQYLYATVSNGYIPSQVTATITGDNGYSATLTGKTVDGKQRFLLRNSNLNIGNYLITATLAGASSGGIIREKFSKTYNGAPKVGID